VRAALPGDDTGPARSNMIEFMGLPGAGKTTGAALLQRGQWGRDRRLVPVAEAFWSSARREAAGILKPLLLRMPRVIRHPLAGPMSRLDLGHLFLSRECRFCEVVFREMSCLPDPLQRQSFLYALLIHAVQREVIERHFPPDLLVVAEEGFAQRAMTLFGYRPEEAEADRLAAYVRFMPKPAAVVWVDTEPDLCAARLARRGQPPYPLQSLPAPQWPAQLARARRVLASAAAALQESGVPVVAVRGDRDDLAEQVSVMLAGIR
jgi:hypothetical protein